MSYIGGTDEEWDIWLAAAPIQEVVAYARDHIVNQGEYWGDIVDRLCAEVERLKEEVDRNLWLRNFCDEYGNVKCAHCGQWHDVSIITAADLERPKL